jgi:hypothetical protein
MDMHHKSYLNKGSVTGLLSIIIISVTEKLGVMAHACNSCYLGDRQEDQEF